MKKLLALENENVKCENCGKIIIDKVITLSSTTYEREINLCVNCFIGMTAQKLEFLDWKNRKNPTQGN